MYMKRAPPTLKHSIDDSFVTSMKILCAFFFF